MAIARKEGATLRHAQSDDMPRVDGIAIACYAPIQRSYVQMLGEQCYQAVRHDPQLTWEERKTGQIRRLFRDHPEWVWVLEKEGNVIGFVIFMLFPDQNYGHIDNNGVAPEHAGKGWGKIHVSTRLAVFQEKEPEIRSC